jgi:acetyl-CoA carboxylase biotin carboxyl carrier protein
VTLTARDVAEITRLLEESQFDELHLEHEGLKLTLRRSGAAQGAPPHQAPVASADPAAPPPAADPRAKAAVAVPEGAVHEVSAPLLGTFYRAPKPGADPYVESGSAVREDTIIGIIEVMKLMNAVRAGVAGTVAEILVTDGALVEYGQTLLRVLRGAP